MEAIAIVMVILRGEIMVGVVVKQKGEEQTELERRLGQVVVVHEHEQKLSNSLLEEEEEGLSSGGCICAAATRRVRDPSFTISKLPWST